jgi:hypothetical protein
MRIWDKNQIDLLQESKQIAKSRDVEDLCSLAVLNSICRIDDYSDFCFADDGNWLCEML